MPQVFIFKQKPAYEMRISDWSSDVCSSDLPLQGLGRAPEEDAGRDRGAERHREPAPARENGRRIRPADDPPAERRERDRKGVVLGTSVSARVDLGGRRVIKRY